MRPYKLISAFVIAMLILGSFQVSNSSAQASNVISGRVLDNFGIGIEGVTIRLILDKYTTFLPIISTNSITLPGQIEPDPPDSTQSFYEILTDVNGKYYVDNIPSGRYVVTADKEGLVFSPFSCVIINNVENTICDFHTIDVPTILSPITNNLPEATISQLQSISPDGIVYIFSSETPELEQVEVGEIIMGGPTSVSPGGFIRKVINKQYSGDNLVLETEPATLEEAFKNIAVNVTRDLSLAGASLSTDVPGITLIPPKSESTENENEIRFDSAVIYDKDNDYSTTNDQILGTGIMGFRSKFQLKFLIINNELVDFYTSTTLDIQSGFELSSKISISIPIVERPVIPQVVLPPFPIAGLLWVTPQVDIMATLSGSIDLVNIPWITHTTSFTTGLELINGKLRPFGNYDNNTSYSATPSYFSSYSINFGVGPVISLKLQSVLGPYFKAHLGIKADYLPTLNPFFTLKGGIVVAVGVSAEIPIIRKKLIDFQVVSYEKWYLLKAISYSNNNSPNPPTNPSPTPGEANSKLQRALSWTGGDPDGDTVTYDIYFEAWDSTPDLLVAQNLFTPSFTLQVLNESTIYYWRVVAKDEHGSRTYGSVWRFYTMETDWNIVESPTSDILISLEMISNTDGWAGGLHGSMLHWNGFTWEEYASSTTDRVAAFAFASLNDGWASIFIDQTGAGWMYRWNGFTWQQYPQPLSNGQISLSIVPGSNGSSIYSAGNNGSIMHWDGVSWESFYSIPAVIKFYDIQMISENDGWVVGCYFDCMNYTGAIFHWNGSYWQEIPGPVTGSGYYTIEVVSSNDIWITGAKGILLHWDGIFWEQIGNPTEFSVTLSIIPESNGNQAWAVGAYGTILYWNGFFWSEAKSPVGSSLARVEMLSALDGWAVGANGIILRYRP